MRHKTNLKTSLEDEEASVEFKENAWRKRDAITELNNIHQVGEEALH